MEPVTIKPGVKSSEFYVTMASSLVGLGVMLGYIPENQADAFVDAVVAVIGGLMVIVPTVVYIASRLRLKQTQVLSGTTSSTMPISDKVDNLTVEPQFYPR